MVKEKAPQKVDIDAIINKARSNFKNSEKGLGLQIVKGSEIKLSDRDEDYICWPNSAWQVLTGIRGLPFGRIVQIAGRPDSGKSTHAMEFMSRAQKAGYIVVLWDAEKKFGSSRFEKYFGGKNEELFVITSQMILEGIDEVDAVIHAIMAEYPEKKILIVWDSVGGTLSKSEGALDKRQSKQMAEAAKDNGQAVRGLAALMEQYKDKKTGDEKIAVLLINQVYANIGSHGQKESGGQKVEFHSSIIIQLTRKANLNKMKNNIKRKVGITTKAVMKKNHLFDSEDSIAEIELDITARGVFVNSKSPILKLVGEEQQVLAQEQLEESPDDVEMADEGEIEDDEE
jgi:RecA/RadA recombinase